MESYGFEWATTLEHCGKDYQYHDSFEWYSQQNYMEVLPQEYYQLKLLLRQTTTKSLLIHGQIPKPHLEAELNSYDKVTCVEAY